MSGRRVLTVENVTLGYGAVTAVEDVSFALDEGEYACLVGRNGCGKSTLIKGILGLVRPWSGCIDLVVGKDGTAFLPQAQQAARDFPATVWEVVLSGCQRGGGGFWYSGGERDTARRCMDILGIGGLSGRHIGTLSGGQRQRVFLARCLCRDPKFLILDEPYTGLDPDAARGLSDTLDGLRERGIAILMSSHDFGTVASCASRVLVLEGGLVFDGDVCEWLARFQRVDVLPGTTNTLRPAGT